MTQDVPEKDPKGCGGLPALRFLPWILALLAGLLTGSSFLPLPQRLHAWLPWLAMAPLVWAVWMLPLPRQGGPGRKEIHLLLLGWVCGFVGFLLSLHWITTVTAAGWVALCAYLGIYPALWAVFAGTLLRRLGGDWLGSVRNLLVALLGAATWTGLEWIRGWLFSGFGWNALGVALGDNLPIAQIASFTGTAGLTFLCVLSSAMGAITVERLRHEIRLGRARPHVDFFLTVFLVVASFSHGVRVLTAPAEPSLPLRVAGLQGNIPVYDYWAAGKEESILDRYLGMTRDALKENPDLLVWPEAATPRPLLLDEVTYGAVRDLALGSAADFLIGSIHYQASPRGDYNSAILLSRRADAVQIYNKVHLVPFGEFVPFRKILPILAWIERKEVPYDFDAGKGPALLEMSSRPVKLGPLVCFEDTLGEQTRQTAALGAQMLVTLTNDGWFGTSVATRQHLANARLRTVETGLPLLRVADTGISCVVDRFGRIREELSGPGGDTFVQGILKAVVAVPEHPAPTFYTRHGDLFAKLCLVLSAGAGILLAVFRRFLPRNVI